jgi:lysophospholipase L1-like esterase
MVVLAGLFAAGAASAQNVPQCQATAETAGLEHAPEHIRDRVAKGLPLKIVAIGSSSTAGAGATSPDKTYPARLEAELKARLPGLPVTVVNKGIGGEEAAQMVARFDADVVDEAPDLVVWQVGSNSVLLNHDAPGAIIHQGIERLKRMGTDIILMNQQFAPKIIDKGERALRSVDVIIATARDEEVGLFNRWVAMRAWVETQNMPFEQFMTADGLHMNDWGYGCVAHLLADAILDGTKLPAATARSSTAQ